jgi:hypothetical protein
MPADIIRCNAAYVWPCDSFARTPRAETFCEKPLGHAGAHEATLGTTAFVWRDGAAVPQ